MDNLRVLSYAAQDRREVKIEFRKDCLEEQGLPHSDLRWAEVSGGLAGVRGQLAKRQGKLKVCGMRII